MKSRIVITGAGAVSAIGTGTEEFWRALASGRIGIKPINNGNANGNGSPIKWAARIADFNVRDYISQKGVSRFSRAAQFVCAAARLALREARLEITPENRNDVAVVIGTAFGSANSLDDFEQECRRDGERFVDPMSFPKTVANSPAGNLAILLGAAGPNITISTGLVSGLGAVEYAASLIDEGRARIVIAGGYDELSLSSPILLEDEFELNRGFYRGEGAGLLVFERFEDALARQAPIIAELAGVATVSCVDESRAAETQQRAMREAMRQAGLDAKEIDYVSLSANGSRIDEQEILALEDCFGERANRIPRTAIKSLLGECGGASGALQLIAAAQSIRYQSVPPTARLYEDEAGELIRELLPAPLATRCENVLVNSFNGIHNNSSAVVRKVSTNAEPAGAIYA